jgi:hypothetical protein
VTFRADRRKPTTCVPPSLAPSSSHQHHRIIPPPCCARPYQYTLATVARRCTLSARHTAAPGRAALRCVDAQTPSGPRRPASTFSRSLRTSDQSHTQHSAHSFSAPAHTLHREPSLLVGLSQSHRAALPSSATSPHNTPARARTHLYAPGRAHTGTCTHVHLHARIRTHTRSRTLRYTPTHMHTRAHQHTHTHTHTQRKHTRTADVHPPLKLTNDDDDKTIAHHKSQLFDEADERDGDD